jgi:hypothetical protein
MPMTDEMLKRLPRVIVESDQTINFPDLSAVLVSQKIHSAIELNLQHPETNQSDPLTNNRY